LDKKICGLILAAGKSERMGSVKPALKIGGVSVIDLTTQMLKKAGLTEIFTVLGCHRDVILQEYAAKDTVTIVDNPHYEEGMLSSVKAGVMAMLEKGNYDGFVMVPADCPAISPDTVIKVIDSFSGENKIIKPDYHGKGGHPVLFSMEYADEIINNDFAEGLRTLIRSHNENFVRIPVEDANCLLDMDTPENYREIEKIMSTSAE